MLKSIKRRLSSGILTNVWLESWRRHERARQWEKGRQQDRGQKDEEVKGQKRLPFRGPVNADPDQNVIYGMTPTV